jgi:hypothetical protein
MMQQENSQTIDEKAPRVMKMLYMVLELKFTEQKLWKFSWMNIFPSMAEVESVHEAIMQNAFPKDSATCEKVELKVILNNFN